MLRTVQSVDGATPPGHCSPPSLAASSSPAVDVNPVIVFTTRAAVYTKDGNDVVGVIDFFDESRCYKGPTIGKSAREGPYPGVYTDGVDGELDVVDADTHAAWRIDTDPDLLSLPGPDPDDVLSAEEIKARADRWDSPESIHPNQVGLNHRWGEDGEDDGDDVVPQRDPCSYNEIRSCSCCRCPDCYDRAKSIRARKNKTPRYACSNPACDTEGFETPVRIVETITTD